MSGVGPGKDSHSRNDAPEGWKGHFTMPRSNGLKGKVYDISILLGEEQIDAPIPGVKAFLLERVFSITEGGPCNLSNVSMNCHAGTHIDVPAHYVRDSNTIDSYPAERFILSAEIVETGSDEVILKEDLDKTTIKAGDAVLFKTNNSIRGICRNPKMDERWVYLSPEAAQWCVERKVGLVGIDYFDFVTIDLAFS
jgi:arylformamidase